MNQTSMEIKSFATCNGSRLDWCVTAVLAFICISTLIIYYTEPILDGDIWFHLLYGQYFLENMTLIPDHTIYSWTPSTNETIYCTWFSDILLYFVYKIGGIVGLYVIKYSCVLFFVYIIYSFARKVNIGHHPFIWMIILLAGWMSVAGVIVKSEIFSFVFFTVFCWNWWSIRFENADEKWWRVYLFPLIMLVWVNSHGGFVFGAVFLLAIALGELLNLLLKRNALALKIQKHLLMACILSAVAIFITPYGYHYPLQIIMLHLPGGENQQYMDKIMEYADTFTSIQNVWALTFADVANLSLVLLVLLLIGAGFKNIEWSVLIANIVFAGIYTKLGRTTYFWAPVFSFSSIFLMRFHSKLLFKQGRKIQILVLLIVLVTVITFSSFIVRDSIHFPQTYSWLGVGVGDSHPVEETKFIEKYLSDKVVGNTYNEGSYLLWERYPENKVFLDSRHFPYRDWSQEYFKFSNGLEIESFLEKFRAEVWMVSHSFFKLNTWFINSPDWNLIYYGLNSAVYLRSDLPVPKREKRVGALVAETKNYFTARNLLKLSVELRDWETAAQVVDRITSYFTHPKYRFFTGFAPLYMEGIKAYIHGEYQIAAEKLSVAGKYSLISVDLEIAYSYLFLADIKLKNKEIIEAHTLSGFAYRFNPKNIYTIYYFGVLDWYMDQVRSKSDPTDKEIKKEAWRELFTIFVEEAPRAPKAFQECREFASAVLSGEKPAKVPQLLPARPRNKSYYYPLD